MKHSLIKSSVFVVTFFVILSSCRSTDTDNNFSQGTTSVNINLLESKFLDEDPEAKAITGSKLLLTDNIVQRHYTLLDPSTVVTTELSQEPVQKYSGTTRAGLDSAGNPLANGTMFRVIAYRENGQYHIHQDYTVGTKGLPLMLDNSKPYTIIAYSFGTSVLPVISSTETGNLSSAQTTYGQGNTDFMFQSLSLTPKDAETTLNLILEHRITQLLSATVNTVAIAPLNSITSASLGPNYSTGTISLSNKGYITGTDTAPLSVALPSFSRVDDYNMKINNLNLYINGGGGEYSDGVGRGLFTTTITIGNELKTIKDIPFKLTPGARKNLTIKFEKCLVLIAGKPRAFMCHNLGADTSVNPYVPSAQIQGAKYQWGNKTPVLTQQQDLDIQGKVPNWPQTYSPNTAWLDTAKGPEDPCPDGYRVPSQSEMSSLLRENTRSAYASGMKFSSPSLGSGVFFPQNGYRDSEGGSLLGKYTNVAAWTSTFNDKVANEAMSFGINADQTWILSNNKRQGQGIRCISEK